MANLAEPLAIPGPVFRSRVGPIALRALRVRAWPAVRQYLLVLLALYVLKQGIFVVAFKPFTGHDEVAHYSYIRTLATEARIPVLPDLNAFRTAVQTQNTPTFDTLPNELYPYCRYALDWFCEPERAQWARTPPHMVTLQREYYPSGFQYVANHPPLYYALMTPVYWATASLSPETQQYILRAAAIPFGIATVVLAYLLTRTLFPGDTFLAVTVPTFVAFQPQISYEAAMVNNDIVSIAFYSLVLWLIVVGIRDRFPDRTSVAVGVALGLALLAKGTSVSAALIIAVAMILAVGWRNVRSWLRSGVLIVLPALVLAGPWYVFLYRTYGNLDGFDQIAALQYDVGKPEGTFLDLLTDRDFVVMRFKETWSEFGWRLIHFSPVLLWAIALPLIIAFGGLVQYALTAGRNLPGTEGDAVMHPTRWQWQALAVLGLTCVVAYLAVVQFGTRFQLTQARYFFPAVNAASLLVMLGLRTLVPRRLRPLGQGVVFGSLVLLNALIFTQYVIPFYWSS